jgi:osmotically-inducible protein OsmY
MNDDAKIRDNVIAELDFEPQVDATAIGVSVKDGIVTLTGHVPHYMQKLAAEAATRRVKGVIGLAQEIEVRFPTETGHSDDELANRASHILNWTIVAPKDGIKVKVEKGWITLRGEAQWAYQKQDVERALRRLEGVTGVTNLITVHSALSPGDVKGNIKRAFHRNAELEADGIDVTVDGAKVILTGKAGSWAQRRAAENAAWSAAGVNQVVDNIAVG